MHTSFLTDGNESTSAAVSLQASCDPVLEREFVKILVIGSRRGVISIIHTLHQLLQVGTAASRFNGGNLPSGSLVPYGGKPACSAVSPPAALAPQRTGSSTALAQISRLYISLICCLTQARKELIMGISPILRLSSRNRGISVVRGRFAKVGETSHGTYTPSRNW